ncbi:MAG: o-succinylbenzoate--CoA ligase [Lentisphaerae bacterium]|nr:o-succinylbenzoate--CoA ligase [Lentisphaerota bacterium]
MTTGNTQGHDGGAGRTADPFKAGAVSTVLACPLRAAARRWPDAPALLDARGVLAFSRLDAQVDAAAAVLRARGVGAGARVALNITADRRGLVLLLAVMRTGAAACLLNRRNPPARLAAQVAQIQPVGLVADEPASGAWPSGMWVCAPEALLAAPATAGTDAAPLTMSADAPVTVIFTSGSTATPKAALHSLGNHLASAAASNRLHGLTAADRWLLSLPLYHVGGLAIVFRCLLAGATIAIPERDEDLAAALVRLSITQLSMVPTQLARLVERPGARPPPSLACLLLGGAPAPDALVQAALAQGWPVRKTYGLTEMSSQVTAVTPGASAAQALSAGRPLDGVDLRLRADGEILVRGAGRFLGYWENGRPVPPVDAEGWLATGDLGRLDASGYLTVTGRKDNLFISGGENIQPEEIEAALQALPHVAQAMVVPVADAVFGQRPVACVRLHRGPLDGAALAQALAADLPRYKIPVAFFGWPPELESGDLKASRPLCRQWAQAQWQRGVGMA